MSRDRVGCHRPLNEHREQLTIIVRKTHGPLREAVAARRKRLSAVYLFALPPLPKVDQTQNRELLEHRCAECQHCRSRRSKIVENRISKCSYVEGGTGHDRDRIDRRT
jgi:hypothetical protein